MSAALVVDFVGKGGLLHRLVEVAERKQRERMRGCEIERQLQVNEPEILVCTENLVRIDLMRESLNVGHDGRADISLRAGLYKDRANKANVKIGQRKCHITST